MATYSLILGYWHVKILLMEAERSVSYSKSRAVNKPANPGATARNQHQEVLQTPTVQAANFQRETDGWIVLGIDRSCLTERLIAFDYTPAMAPAQLIKTARLESRAQLDEFISAGIQGLWDDLPMEIRQQYREAKSVQFPPDIDPLFIIQRGKRAIAQRRKEGSMRVKAVENALKVKVGNDYDAWKVRDAREHPYQASFAEVLPGGSLTRLVQESRQRTGKAFVLDFMGYGQVLRDLPLTGGLAVALGDPRSEDTKQWDTKRNIAFVEGNVLKKSTWIEMQKWLDKQEAEDKKFDLILSRPVRGLDDLTDNEGVNIVLLQRAWQMLSPHDGVLLTQFLEQVFVPDLVDRWVRLLNQTEGIKASYSFTRNPACEPIAFRPALSLVKSEGAPAKLPLL